MGSPQQGQPGEGSGLLQPKHDPESQAEREEQEAEQERRRWEDERPPHYEAR